MPEHRDIEVEQVPSLYATLCRNEQNENETNENGPNEESIRNTNQDEDKVENVNSFNNPELLIE